VLVSELGQYVAEPGFVGSFEKGNRVFNVPGSLSTGSLLYGVACSVRLHELLLCGKIKASFVSAK
jgi:hypothetical protein